MEKGDLRYTYVALDLETTGLRADRDAIIEIGAVKFQGQRVVETFQTLVNPYREIPEFIRRFTGIAQRDVDSAPPFAVVAGELSDFTGSLPVVGHNISFDLEFLSKHGLQLSNEVYDTWDLASILLPYSMDYSLSALAAELGTDHSRPHRALDDAQATHRVFVLLMERVRSLDQGIAAYVHHLAARAQWPPARLFEALPPLHHPETTSLGLTGVDMDALGMRLGRAAYDTSMKPTKSLGAVDENGMAGYLAPGGLFSKSFPGFEHRPQQVEMMSAVAGAINGTKHLVVEGGTGVGKSLAYLLPALLHSMKTGSRVVVSTNTINLQEQLIQKDIPALVRVLEVEGIIPAGEFRAVPLKGRANYLCLQRWSHIAKAESLSKDEARLLSKTLMWLQDSSTGDRGEINLSGKDAVTWNRISANETGQCPGIRGEGLCFLRAARDRAERAHIIVVNHALLLSDLARGGGLLPEYQHLIIDEAQHLEGEATRQLGFQVSQNLLDEELDTLSRALGELRLLLRSSSWSNAQKPRVEEMVGELEPHWSGRIRDNWDRMWNIADGFVSHQQEEIGEQLQLRITSSTRAQPGWSDVEIAWEDVERGLTDGVRQLGRLRHFLDTLPSDGPLDLDTVKLELSACQENLEELQERLKTLLTDPVGEQHVHWMARVDQNQGDGIRRSHLVLNSAPLNVGAELEARLFSRKSSVILTSATLSTQGNFDYIRERVGLAESEELLVGSPFDYRRAALFLIPEDMPMPDAWDYQQAMQQLLVELAKALEGRTLVLYTSHSALKGAAGAIRAPLEAEGIRVLAQGVDGSPRRILKGFSDNPKGVILGTSSFWEGVDLSGGLLKALVVARLPFHVPTEPVFAARSSQYENPFQQYALPQAILRFRQGIGRLIRSSGDKGAIVVLDKRIISRAYGKAFLSSIPDCNVKRGPLSDIPGYAADWTGNRVQA